jgi:hypothetical protein
MNTTTMMVATQLKKIIVMSVLLQWVCCIMVDAFVVLPQRTRTPSVNSLFSPPDGFVVIPRKPIVLNMSERSEAPKRRRKRKIPMEGDTAEESSDVSSTSSSQLPPVVAVNTIKLTPRDDTPVQMEIMDVREVMGGRPKPSARDPSTSSSSSLSIPPTSGSQRDQESSVTSATLSSSSSSSSRNLDDSLQQLLEDAKMMMEDGDSLSGSDGGGTMKATIRNALGTLVTADFFVVCVFLLWFLLGIFCSSVLKDDTVQIAFNSTLFLLPFCLFGAQIVSMV